MYLPAAMRLFHPVVHMYVDKGYVTNVCSVVYIICVYVCMYVCMNVCMYEKGNRSGKNFAAIANGFDINATRGQVVLHIRENLSEGMNELAKETIDK